MPQRIQRLLVANRGEIATRILTAARELDIETWALYTENDCTHVYNASHGIKLSSPADYMNIDELIQIVKRHNIDSLHPGYGFLSESAELARRMHDEAGVIVVGPGPEILDRTGDKLQARRLAEECSVPVLPALTMPTNDLETVRGFARKVGYPIMIKAVDGGGGRGIRLVMQNSELQGHMSRAVEESPSRLVFAEKAAVSGYRHIEVQIVGDGQGNVRHLWERECSIQRRFQKVVEFAPSSITDRRLVAAVIGAALRMAEKIKYTSLGTFEFLVNSDSKDMFFLEVNPRLQVEHTITESICLIDIVKAQLLIALGASLRDAGLGGPSDDSTEPPPLYSLQLRVTAEDPQKKWSLSIGKLQSFHFPSGNGIRVDTSLVSGAPAVVSADFDSLIAKLVITAQTWQDVLQKAKRALDDTRITGVQTNIPMLRAIIRHPDFVAGRCDTQWLEATQDDLLNIIPRAAPSLFGQDLFSSSSNPASSLSLASSSVPFRKDDAWTVTLSPLISTQSAPRQPSHDETYHLSLRKVLRNDFPASLRAEIAFTAPVSSSSSSSTSSSSDSPRLYTLQLASTTASAAALSGRHRRGSPSNAAHVIVPFSGTLIEVCVDEGDRVGTGDVVCVVRQMKMELEVRCSRPGVVSWVTAAEDGEDVAEGMLAAVVDVEEEKEVVTGRARYDRVEAKL